MFWFLTEEFKLIVPSEPVVASVDSDVVLPCQLSPEMSAAAMEVRWFKENFDNLVFLYKEGKETEGLGYRSRVRLFKQEMERGNVSLLLQNVRISDQGIYKCHVSNVDWYEEPQLQLRVTHAQKKLKKYDRVKKELHSLQKVHGNQTDLLDAVRQIPNSVWNRICESKVDVTLDPETAQTTLSVSEGGKTVTLGEKQAVSVS
uniref:Ig-like domain-containing protein n=1 Tax=Lepisosteus oculatus TaxID=7918 RepID=W5M2I9_LEPOC